MGMAQPPVAVSLSSIIRPNNATAYATGQVIGTAATDVIEFKNTGRYFSSSQLGVSLPTSSKNGVILGLEVFDEANQAAKATLELWLFEKTPTVQVDQAAFAPSNADLQNLIGVVALGTPFVGKAGAGAAGNLVYIPGTAVPATGLPYQTDQAVGHVGSIYGVLVVRSAYTPIALEQFDVKLYINADT